MSLYRSKLFRYFTYAYGTQLKTLNPQLLTMQYAIRGPVEIRAQEIKEELKLNNHKFPFNKIVECHIGNPQLMGQQPITYYRQMLGGLLYNQTNLPTDLSRKVQEYKENIGISVGAYSPCNGYPFIRNIISEFIQKRDGLKENPSIDNIMLFDGATQGIKLLLEAYNKSENVGVMIPLPQYPLYSALITMNNNKQIPYYLDESKNWSISMNDLIQQYNDAANKGINPKLLVIINPGNPTGNVLTEQDIQNVIKFAYERNMAIIADEVYQDNVYAGKFVSFNKVRTQMPTPYNQVEIYSFHSTSKGLIGECGLRGGYLHHTEINSEVHTLINKLHSINICPNTVGQLLIGLMCSSLDDCSLETRKLYNQQKNDVMNSLRRKAKLVETQFNSVEGVSCQPIQGSMFAFPRIQLPPQFQNDAQYCMEALENLGLVIVPGQGFGQKDGTNHFRMTILPQEKDLKDVLQRFKIWHHSLQTQKVLKMNLTQVL